MTTKATLVLHKNTKNVLGAVSAVSSATRQLAANEIMGEGVVYRSPSAGTVLATVPVADVELSVEDAEEDVLLQPLSYWKDDTGNLTIAANNTASVALSSTAATVTFTNPAAGEKRKISIVIEYIPLEQRFTHEGEFAATPATIPMTLQAGRAYGVVALVSDHHAFVSAVTAT